jgi:hypothetical protein
MQLPPLRYNHPDELCSSATPDFAPVEMTAGVDDDHVVAIGILRCARNDNMVNAGFCTVEVKERSSFWQALWFHSQEWSVPDVHVIDMD